MKNETYDKLKWIAQVFLPALTVFIGLILTTLKVECAETVVIIMTGLDTFLGAILHKSSKVYNTPSDIYSEDTEIITEEE